MLTTRPLGLKLRCYVQAYGRGVGHQPDFPLNWPFLFASVKSKHSKFIIVRPFSVPQSLSFGARIVALKLGHDACAIATTIFVIADDVVDIFIFGFVISSAICAIVIIIIVIVFVFFVSSSV